MAHKHAFEWDQEKAAQNYGKHGVTFEEATRVFGDPLAVERLDDREDYGEDRFVITAMANETILTVVYAERNERYRLISARYATKAEQDEYFTPLHLRD